MGLREYKRKRDFNATNEPADGGVVGRRIFVVQLHHASHRHFDFRLEFNGVLKSWAVPKGPSFDPKVKRLAVEVEDHPISYATFEGDIPAGNYGAGHVDVFDSGTWEPIGSVADGLARGDLKFLLHGDVLRGSWVLVRTRKQGGKQQWLLIKHSDEYAGSRDADDFVDAKTQRPISLAKRKKVWGVARADVRSPVAAKSRARANDPATLGMAERIRAEPFEPALCRTQDRPPSGANWLHEVKWDGYRMLATIVAGKARLWSRNGIEWTRKLPQLVHALEALGLESAQLDGEIIVAGDGSAAFNALQSVLSDGNEALIVHMIFDMPYRNGRSLRNVALIERERLLAELLLRHPSDRLRYSQHHLGDGATVFAQAVSGGLEGVVSKRVDSGYCGGRSGDWVKAKARLSDDFAVVGFTAPKRSREDIGALLLARSENGTLTYAGRVGTGFDGAQLRNFRDVLQPAISDTPPAGLERMAAKDRPLAIWVKPKLVVEVFHQGTGGNGLLRHPAFKTIRDDISMRTYRNGKKQITCAATSAARTRPARKSMAPALTTALTHPERVVFADLGITKGDVAAYYTAVAKWLLPEIKDRPLAVVRCPDGIDSPCFFQKHVGKGWGSHIQGATIKGKSATSTHVCIADTHGLLDLVQMNVLELHAWGTTAKRPERADRIVFDLDPHASVAWSKVIAAARDVRRHLQSIGLESFVRTSGGKGLHVVVPLDPPAPWTRVKPFAHAIAQSMAELSPEAYVSIAGENNRIGKIFIDWLRNGKGATSIASYSLRARASAGVAMPITWSELGRVKSGDAFTIVNAPTRLRRRKQDPWAQMTSTKQALPTL
ncbi:MAG: DNA ligase D [Dokdonella sp.]